MICSCAQFEPWAVGLDAAELRTCFRDTEALARVRYGLRACAAVRAASRSPTRRWSFELVLGKTLGVPLFQEQAMQVAIVAAGFTPAQADQLRRAMATFKFTAGVTKFRDKLIAGMVDHGYAPDFAERTFKQLEGFGSYGIPESHAASFALIAYASSWMKCHHPEVFCGAILNAQPMGFYAVAQLIGDARAHGVEVRPVDVNRSAWDSTLERSDGGGRLAVRLGLRLVRGLANLHGARLVLARGTLPYASVDELWRRAGVPAAALRRLAAADAFRPAFGLARCEALWAVWGLASAPLPLFAAADARDGLLRRELTEPTVALRAMTDGREVAEDYRTTALSLRQHPLAFLRPDHGRFGHLRCADLARAGNGRRVDVAGLVLIRQKPGSAKGVMFITLEDESGIANLIVWPQLFERQRALVLTAGLLSCRGRVQHQGQVTHFVADHLTDLTVWLRRIGDLDLARLPTGRGDEARHGGSPDQRARRTGASGQRPLPSSAAGRATSSSRTCGSTDLRLRTGPRPRRRSGCKRAISAEPPGPLREDGLMCTTRRVGSFLEVMDEEGCRHLVRVTAVQFLFDTDVLQNETLITAAGRTIRVPCALDQITDLMLEPVRGRG